MGEKPLPSSGASSNRPSREESDPRGEVLRVYVDADVLFAGAASPSEQSASQVVLALSEITLIDAVAADPCLEECRRNVEAKLPDAIELFDQLVARCVTVVPTPPPRSVRAHAGRADWKDLPHLVAALEASCPVLTTFNTSDYMPGHPSIDVLRPGALVRRIRRRLSAM